MAKRTAAAFLGVWLGDKLKARLKKAAEQKTATSADGAAYTESSMARVAIERYLDAVEAELEKNEGKKR